MCRFSTHGVVPPPPPSHGPDSERASCLVNALSTMIIGASGKRMNMFFDNFSLEDGVQFDETFMRGLSRSLVAVPFVTADALARMAQDGSEQHIDHVLLEWWLALILAKASGTKLRFILPIFCGEVSLVVGREAAVFVVDVWCPWFTPYPLFLPLDHQRQGHRPARCGRPLCRH